MSTRDENIAKICTVVLGSTVFAVMLIIAAFSSTGWDAAYVGLVGTLAGAILAFSGGVVSRMIDVFFQNDTRQYELGLALLLEMIDLTRPLEILSIEFGLYKDGTSAKEKRMSTRETFALMTRLSKLRGATDDWPDGETYKSNGPEIFRLFPDVRHDIIDAYRVYEDLRKKRSALITDPLNRHMDEYRSEFLRIEATRTLLFSACHRLCEFDTRLEDHFDTTKQRRITGKIWQSDGQEVQLDGVLALIRRARL